MRYCHLRTSQEAWLTSDACAQDGTRVNSWDHEDVHAAKQSSDILGQISKAGAFLVDDVPFLSNLPFWMQPVSHQISKALGSLTDRLISFFLLNPA